MNFTWKSLGCELNVTVGDLQLILCHFNHHITQFAFTQKALIQEELLCSVSMAHARLALAFPPRVSASSTVSLCPPSVPIQASQRALASSATSSFAIRQALLECGPASALDPLIKLHEDKRKNRKRGLCSPESVPMWQMNKWKTSSQIKGWWMPTRSLRWWEFLARARTIWLSYRWNKTETTKKGLIFFQGSVC